MAAHTAHRATEGRAEGRVRPALIESLFRPSEDHVLTVRRMGRTGCDGANAAEQVVGPELPPASFSSSVFGSTMISLIGGNPVNSSVGRSQASMDL